MDTPYIPIAKARGFTAYSVKIPISTAYATWEGLGLIGTAFIAWLIFNETMPLSKIFAFFIILTGLVMIKIGTKTDSKDDAKAGELDE